MLQTTFNFGPYKRAIWPYLNDLTAINRLVYRTLHLKNQIFLDCSFVGLTSIHTLNRDYRGVDRPTDVISFALWDEGVKTPLLGEIYICYEKIKAQATEYGHSFRRELCFLYLHGLLHLLGYDHQTPADETIMFGLQDTILHRLKIHR